MKTITEMKQQIKEMSAKLDQFARDLLEYNKNGDDSKGVDYKQIKAIGSRNPIEGHILKDADVTVKKQYITLLIAAIYTSSGKTDDAWLLTQRIATGAKFDGELSDISVDAANIIVEQIDEFTRSIIDNDLSQAFALDVMLIYISCGRNDEKMLEFMAALFELVKCNKQEIQDLSKLAQIISEQNSSKYQSLCFKETDVRLGDFLGYTNLFHSGIFSANNNCFFVYFREKTTLSTNLLGLLPETIISKKVVFRNTIFRNIKKETQWFKIKFNQSVTIDNCDFISCDKSLTVEEATTVSIKGCSFREMTNRALYLSKLKSLNILGTVFESCRHRSDDKGGYGYQGEAYGGAMYLDNIPNAHITECIYIKCKTEQSEKGKASSAVAYMHEVYSKWKSCTFIGCNAFSWRYSTVWDNVDNIFGEVREKSISVENCVYDDCKIPRECEKGFKKI